METPGESVEIAFVDQAYTGDTPALEAKEHGIQLGVVKLPKRWVVERSFAWTTRFRRLVRDYERLPETLAGLHFVAFACLMLSRVMPALIASSYQPLAPCSRSAWASPPARRELQPGRRRT